MGRINMSMEIQLINQIEKYEFLYNFNLPEYNRKDLVDEAWTNIAANTNMSSSNLLRSALQDVTNQTKQVNSPSQRSEPEMHVVVQPHYHPGPSTSQHHVPLVSEQGAAVTSCQHLLSTSKVSDCKEKWRNIRSSFLRSMKPSGSKVKKPYYLTEYLKFILPFLKPISIECMDESHYETQGNTVSNETDGVVDFIKTEPEEYGEHDGANNEHSDPLSENGLLIRRTVVRKRRRFVPIGRRNVTEMIKNRGKVTSTYHRHDSQNESSSSSNNSAMRLFLMSLLPELETMTEDQIRMFKVKSMMLIDEIKLNYPQMRQNMSTINSERLQKRLINLLLKSLQARSQDGANT